MKILKKETTIINEAAELAGPGAIVNPDELSKDEVTGVEDQDFKAAVDSKEANKEAAEKNIEDSKIKEVAEEVAKEPSEHRTEAPETPSLKPFTESKKAKDRKELAAFIKEARESGKEFKISRSLEEGYRYIIETYLEEADDAEEIETPEIIEPIEDKSDVCPECGKDPCECPKEEEPEEEKHTPTMGEIFGKLFDIRGNEDKSISLCLKGCDGTEDCICLVTAPLTDEEFAVLEPEFTPSVPEIEPEIVDTDNDKPEEVVEESCNKVNEGITNFDGDLKVDDEDKVLSTDEFVNWHDNHYNDDNFDAKLEKVYAIFSKYGDDEDDVGVLYASCSDEDKKNISVIIGKVEDSIEESKEEVIEEAPEDKPEEIIPEEAPVETPETEILPEIVPEDADIEIDSIETFEPADEIAKNTFTTIKDAGDGTMAAFKDTLRDLGDLTVKASQLQNLLSTSADWLLNVLGLTPEAPEEPIVATETLPDVVAAEPVIDDEPIAGDKEFDDVMNMDGFDDPEPIIMDEEEPQNI